MIKRKPKGKAKMAFDAAGEHSVNHFAGIGKMVMIEG